jgi:RNA polymerase sigma-70 factor (family 1)
MIMMETNLPEQLLLQRSSEGDADAFHQLYQLHKRDVFNLVHMRLPDIEDAKDVVQDIFIDLWLKKEALQAIRDIKPYLYVLARNQVITAYRRKNVQLRNESLLFEGLNTLDHSAEDNTIAKELYAQINEIVEQLPETTRQCYHLSKNEGKRNGEIADLLNISEKTVRNNLSEALKRLKSHLSQSHPELLALLVLLIK